MRSNVPSAVYFISTDEAKNDGVRDLEVIFIALHTSNLAHFLFAFIKDSLNGASSFFAFRAELVNNDRVPDNSLFTLVATLPIFFDFFPSFRSNTNASNITSVGSDVPSQTEIKGARFTICFSKVLL